MASGDESLTMVSSLQEEEYDDTDDGSDRFHHQNHHGSLSRLSVCTSSMYTNDDSQDGDCIEHESFPNPSDMGIFMSGLSLESFDGADADGEGSDAEKRRKQGEDQSDNMNLVSSDSDKESGCYSLPATPPRRRRKQTCGILVNNSLSGGKEYWSENEARKGRKGNSRRQRRVMREKFSWADSDHSSGGGGGGGGGGGVMIIAKPKGGEKSLCMDMEEVKACKDLGFELGPVRVSVSAGSGLETSSGGNSPIANWRISSPGDDPRDVKARLKVWAQAVALSSTSRHVS